MERVLGFLVIFIVVTVMLCVIVFQIQGAAECAADGGQYLRTWTGWPTCVVP